MHTPCFKRGTNISRMLTLRCAAVLKVNCSSVQQPPTVPPNIKHGKHSHERSRFGSLHQDITGMELIQLLRVPAVCQIPLLPFLLPTGYSQSFPKGNLQSIIQSAKPNQCAYSWPLIRLFALIMGDLEVITPPQGIYSVEIVIYSVEIVMGGAHYPAACQVSWLPLFSDFGCSQF